jgi:BlaI family transcriptional regulator, penicillinase repressor
MADNPADLGDLEREVMQIIWASQAITSEAVRERLSRPLKESTVRTVLKRLEGKKFVTHLVCGRTYVFAATLPRRQVAARAVQRIVDLLCNGSVDELLVGIAESGMLDSTRLKELAQKAYEDSWRSPSTRPVDHVITW